MSVSSLTVFPRLWERITCAVDGGPAGLISAREIAWLMPAGAQLTLQAVDPEQSPEHVHALIHALEREGATLACAASTHAGRVASQALTPLVLALLRDAPCSVLITPEKPQSHRRDGAIAVGLDGSGGGFGALSIARELAERRSLELHVLEDPEPTVGALVEAAAGAELLILGSSAAPWKPGSIGEQVVRRASCSVLVARGTLLSGE